MTASPRLRCRIDGIGVWGPGFSNWPELRDCFLGSGHFDDAQLSGPKPEIIPANERRRAPLPVRLAVETSWQASQHASINPKDLSCVFSSGFGDIDITNYMCSTLNSETKQLSPTKFHNSVHNAPAGYWTISTECMRSANSVAGFAVSTPVTILEAMAQSITTQEPSLLTFCDAPAKGPLISVLINQLPFSASLVLSPIPETSKVNEGELTLSLSIVHNASDWPPLSLATLDTLYRDNPSARILCLLEAIALSDTGHTRVTMPLSKETSLELELQR